MIIAAVLDPNSPAGFGFVVLILLNLGGVVINGLIAYGTVKRRPPIEVDLASKANLDELEDRFLTRREWDQHIDQLRIDNAEARRSRTWIQNKLTILLQRTSGAAGFGEVSEDHEEV